MVKMMKALFLSFLAIGFLSCNTVPVSRFNVNTPRLRIKSHSQSFVTLYMSFSQCSGSIVQFEQNKKAYVLTASHCMSHDTQATVKFFDDSTRLFTLVDKGKRFGTPEDWAILEGDTQFILPLQVADKEIQMFPIITMYVGRDQFIMPAVILGYAESRDFEVAGAIQPGDSGGAILSEDGKICGVIHSYAPGTGIGFAAPIWGVPIPKSPVKGQSKEKSQAPSSNPHSMQDVLQSH